MGVVGCGLELDHPTRRGSGPCQLSLAALRHNENATGSRPAGSARPSCSPPASGSRGRPPARGLGSGGQRLYGRFKAGGTEALRSRGPSGPTPRLSDAQLATVEQALLEGATAHGFAGELWTLDRIAIVIERLTGVQHHPAWVWALLRHRLGWSVQRPKRRAAERDQAAIDRWVKEDWPRILQTPNDAEPAWSSSTSPRSA
jgi:transposase